jgi:hypothetical protein
MPLKALDRTLQDIRDDQRPFGGITVILGGDFLQTLPVVPRGSREWILSMQLFNAHHLWEHIEILSLRRNMRLEQGQSRMLENLLNGCWMSVMVEILSMENASPDFLTTCAQESADSD